MPRPREDNIRITAYLPEELYHKVRFFLWDPIYQRIGYGEVSKLITRLVEEWVQKMESAYESRHGNPNTPETPQR